MGSKKSRPLDSFQEYLTEKIYAKKPQDVNSL